MILKLKKKFEIPNLRPAFLRRGTNPHTGSTPPEPKPPLPLPSCSCCPTWRMTDRCGRTA